MLDREKCNSEFGYIVNTIKNIFQFRKNKQRDNQELIEKIDVTLNKLQAARKELVNRLKAQYKEYKNSDNIVKPSIVSDLKRIRLDINMNIFDSFNQLQRKQKILNQIDELAMNIEIYKDSILGTKEKKILEMIEKI
jgi:hypothetical protein